MMLGGIIGHDNQSMSRARWVPDLSGLRTLGQFDNLRLLGRACADLVPHDPQELFDAAGIGSATETHEQLTGFARKRQEDFLRGRTRIVSGWVLAEAECALCVLCAQA
jgi:hypothetical protein